MADLCLRHPLKTAACCGVADGGGLVFRMGLNSFLAKGWTATMTAAIFALPTAKIIGDSF